MQQNHLEFSIQDSEVLGTLQTIPGHYLGGAGAREVSRVHGCQMGWKQKIQQLGSVQNHLKLVRNNKKNDNNTQFCDKSYYKKIFNEFKRKNEHGY